jgi:hypothetical protein
MKIWATLTAFRDCHRAARLSQSHRQTDNRLPAGGAVDVIGSLIARNVMALPLLTALAALGMLTTAVQAETYPTRPIKLIVPFPPGGPVDVMARVVVQRLSNSLGQIIIDT